MSGHHPTHPHPELQGLRVTGVLDADAVLLFSAGHEPHAFLDLLLRTPGGVPCHARVDLGTDTTDHMHAKAMLPAMRKHALVSVAAEGAAMPRTDHARAVHQLVGAKDLLLLAGPPVPTPTTTHSPEAAHVR